MGIVSDTDTATDTVEYRPQTKRDDAGTTGPIAKLFSIFSRRKNAIPAERRLKPRTLDASRRRALLVAQGRREK